MKITHVIQGIEAASGVSVFCCELAKAQAETGHSVTILYSYKPEYPVSRSVSLICGASLSDLKTKPDCVHIHGIWSPYCASAMNWCLRNHIPYVVSVHGGLMPRVLQKGWLKKWLFYNLCIKRLLNSAEAVHVTSEPERDACNSVGVKARLIYAPLGVEISNADKIRDKEGRVILFVSRLAEEKGLMLLLDAWRTIEHAGWRLVLAGPDWKGYERQVRDKIANERIKDVALIGFVFGEEKVQWYRKADLFVLPSPMENFSSVVLEALSFGVPVIATQGTPWKDLMSYSCGWWIGQGVAPLQRALELGMELSDQERIEMGKRARELVRGKYSWCSVAEKIESSYNSARLSK